MTAYQAALLGQSAPVRDRFVPAPPGSIAALIASYMRSAEYIGLRDTSKTGYTSRLEMLRTEHGHRTVRRNSDQNAFCATIESGAALS
jgi:enterobacteria phage integrase